MSGIRNLTVSAVVSAILAGSTAIAADNKFTAADVLEWKIGQQDWYFETSIMMAAIVASKNRSTAASCIDQWYFANPEDQPRLNDEMRSFLEKHSSRHPGIVVVAVIERECGTLNFTN